MMQEGRRLGRPPLPHERLTEGDVAKLLAPGQEGQRLCDGGGLYARRIGDGAAYWVFRFCDHFRGGAEREISLGPQAALSLDNARVIAAGLREQIAAGYRPNCPTAAATEMGVTAHTISFHLRSIYEKLQVHSKSEAVAKALRAGIIS